MFPPSSGRLKSSTMVETPKDLADSEATSSFAVSDDKVGVVPMWYAGKCQQAAYEERGLLHVSCGMVYGDCWGLDRSSRHWRSLCTFGLVCIRRNDGPGRGYSLRTGVCCWYKFGGRDNDILF